MRQAGEGALMVRASKDLDIGRPAAWNHFAGTFLIPCLGFALLRVFVMMLDNGQVYQSDYLPFFVGNLARGCVPLLVVACIGARPLSARTMLWGFLPCAVVAGAAGAAVVGGALDGSQVLLAAGRGMALGALGWMYVCWAEVYRYVKIRDVALSMIASMIVSSLLAFAFALMPRAAVAAGALAVPCAVVGLFALFERRGYPVQEDRLQFSAREGATAAGLDGTWFVALSLFSVAMGVAHVLSISSPNAYEQMVSFGVYTAVSVVFATLLLVSVLVRNGVLSLRACWAVFVLVTCAALGFSLVHAEGVQIALAVFSGVRYVALAYLNIKLVDIAHHSKMPAYAVFAIGWGVLLLFMSFGLSMTLNGIYGGMAVSTPLIVLCATLATGSVFIFGGSTFGDVRIAPSVDQEEGPAPGAEAVLDIQYRRCAALQAAYGLTQRETEVVFLIAQGYTQAYCADALMVSLNTVRTHMKRVYTKMDIHAKDELLQKLGEAL